MSSADQIRTELSRVARSLGAADDFQPVVERPRDPSFGDWATSMALVLAKPLGRKPRELAQEIIADIDRERAGISAAELAGPGFINFRVSTNTVAQGLLAMLAAGESFGRSAEGANCSVNVEFVSANPTGPLHVGH